MNTRYSDNNSDVPIDKEEVTTEDLGSVKSCCGGAEQPYEESERDFPHTEASISSVTISFVVKGMSCESCARKIEKTLAQLPGVARAVVNFTSQEASIHFKPSEIDSEQLKTAVKAAGYQLLETNKGDQRESVGQSLSKLVSNPYPYIIGVATAASAIGFYLGLLTLTSDWFNARQGFKEFWPWILALAFGLGIQATLYSFMKIRLKEKKVNHAKYTMVASGGMSTSAMAACCAHYLVPILPILGLPFLSAAAAGLARYQTYFFVAGVLSSVFGIVFMLRIMDRYGMIPAAALTRGLRRFKPKRRDLL